MSIQIRDPAPSASTVTAGAERSADILMIYQPTIAPAPSTRLGMGGGDG
jgi:hypothetical protein